MITYIRRAQQFSFYLSRIKYFESFAKIPKINILKYEADMAQKIINIIAQEDYPIQETQVTSLAYPSLRQRIVELIKNYEKLQEKNDQNNLKAQGTAKQNMLKYFTTGVYLPGNYCPQLNMGENLVNDSQLSADQINDIPTVIDITGDIKEYKRIIFCPTYHITAKVFKNILSISQKHFQYYLMTGYNKIGKTHSFILYRILSQIVFKYRYLKNQKQYSLKEIKLHQEKIPKLIFWNAPLKQNQIPKVELQSYKSKIKKTLQEQLLNQCFQLKSIQPNFSFFSYSQQNQKLFKLYSEKGIRLIIVFQGIDAIASARRKYEQYASLWIRDDYKIREIESLTIRKQSKEYLLQYLRKQSIRKIEQKMKISVQNLYCFYDRGDWLNSFKGSIIRSNFNRVIYSSKNDIKDMLAYLRLNFSSDPYLINRINRITFQYPQKYNSPKLAVDIAELFIFQIQRNILCKNTIINEYNKQNQQITRDEFQNLKFAVANNIHKIFKQKLLEQPWYFANYMTLLSISLRINIDLIKFQDLFTNFRSDNLKQYLQNIVEGLQREEMNIVKFKIDQFMRISNSYEQVKLKTVMLFRLYFEALHLLQQNPFKLQQKQRTVKLRMKQSQIVRTLAQKADHNLFIYCKTCMHEQYFQCLINPYFLVNSLQPVIKDIINQFIEIKQPIQKHFNENLRKLCLKNIFMETFLEGGQAFVQLTAQKLNNKQKDIINIKTRLQNISENILSFIPNQSASGKNYSDLSFLPRFKETIFSMIQSKKLLKGQNYLFLPVKNRYLSTNQQVIHKKIQIRQIDFSSRLIDFIICEYKDDKQIIIHAFNISIDRQEARTKIQQFLLEYLTLHDNQEIFGKSFGIKAKLNYIVLSTTGRQIDYQLMVKNLIIKQKEKLNNQQNYYQKQIIEKLIQRLQKLKIEDNYKSFSILNKTNGKQQKNKLLLQKVAVIPSSPDFRFITSEQNISPFMNLLKKLIL